MIGASFPLAFTFDPDMDVPYNKSGASSRAHYQIVRNVENAPHQTEQLVRQDVERLRQRITGKLLSTSELRKDLIILLYCLNSSFGSVNTKTLPFALPSAVHLAEAGSRVSEKRIGYLFCWEVMPREHELQLMLVNTIRKDLTSFSVAKICLALESLINLPSADVVPAVQTRCVELLSHPSARIRVLAMKALQALAKFAPDLLNDENIKQLMRKRLEDGDESVVKAALRFGVFMAESNLLEGDKMLRLCISLVIRILDRHSTRTYSPAFTLSVLGIISRLYVKEETKAKKDVANELLPSVLVTLRRAIKHDQKSLILECFRLLGRFPSTAIIEYITKASSQTTESPLQGERSDGPRHQFIHPVARIRHFLSSRTVNDHYLFLSCLVCLEPSLWAGVVQSQSSESLLGPDGGKQQAEGSAEPSEENAAAIPPILDQLEVERVLSFVESEDDQIRSLTLRILITLDPLLVETCYTRLLDSLRASGSSILANNRLRNTLLQRLVDLASAISLGNEKSQMEERGTVFIHKLREVVDAAGAGNKVNGTVVEAVLSRIRSENTSIQRACILGLLSLLQPGVDETQQLQIQGTSTKADLLNETLFLILVALTCELASIFTPAKSEVVSLIGMFASVLHVSPVSMQEPLLLCMTRLVALLSLIEFSSLEIDDVRRVVHELGEASLADKRAALPRRCQQFEKALDDPEGVRRLLGDKQNISLPEFAVLLDQADQRLASSPTRSPQKPSSPPASQTSPIMNSTSSPSLSQSRLRYDAYAPPSTTSSIRLFRARSHSSTASASGRSSSNRPSSRASSSRLEEGENEADLSRTVTAGELTLAAGSRSEFARMYKNGKGKIREVELPMEDLKLNDAPSKMPTDLLAVDSPFLPEPLVDVKDIVVNPIPSNNNTPPASSPYVSASTSLRTSPERGPSFEVLWNELDAFSTRGWCEDAVDVVVRRLQGLGLRMDVLDVDGPPFKGDLKISLYSLGSWTPSAVLRIHEEEDGSCLWQVKSSNRELALKVKETMI